MDKDSVLYSLLTSSVRNIYGAEQEILHNLSHLAESPSVAALSNVFFQFRGETKQQIERLEKVMHILSITTHTETAPSPEKGTSRNQTSNIQGIQGILQEGLALLSQFSDTEAADMVILSIGEKMKYFEIACYSFICMLAQSLEEDEVFALMKISLEEEKAMEMRLLDIAKSEMHVSL